VIIDLEDATAPSEKDRAAEVLSGMTLPAAPTIVVRVNPDPEDLERDLPAAVKAGAAGVILPKVHGPWQVRRCAWFLEEAGGTGLAIMPMIESARAVLRALDIADADKRVASLMFGGGDLSAVVGWLRTTAGEELTTARNLVVLAASAAGIGAVDTPWLDIKDVEGARAESRRARDMGFTGKFAIHPSHVAAIHEGFAPSAEEVQDARGLIEAFERGVAAGTGVTTYKGRMIDRPDALQAQRVLARARA
jgi:citrate lyase subunit beta/citryl-CoA lyase